MTNAGWRLALLPVLCLGSSLGCGDDSASSGDLALADLSMPKGADLASATYPAGPYGNTVGATIAPLVWEGYADPTADALASTKPYGPYSMNDLRSSGRPYGIVHVSSFS